MRFLSERRAVSAFKKLFPRVRNCFSPSNQWRIDALTILECRANVLNSEINSQGGNRIFLEDGVRLRNTTVHLRGEDNTLRIGSGAFLTAHIELYGDGNSIEVGERSRINPDKDILIGRQVWLGRGVSVLKGALIEDEAFVGAMSLVNGHLPSASLAAGVPAKFLRTGITWQQ